MAKILYLGGNKLDEVHYEYAPVAEALSCARDSQHQADLRQRFGACAFQIMPPGASQIAEALELEPFSG